MEYLREISKQIQDVVNFGVDFSSRATAHGLSSAIQEARDLAAQGTALASKELAWVGEEAEKIEKVGLVYLKEGLKIAADHPEAAQAGGAASLVLLLPFTRRALTRSVIRMFRSEEAQFRSAEHKVDALSKRLEELKGESHKLKERYVIAETELLSGRKKVEAVGSQLDSLAKDIISSENKLQSTLDGLSYVKGQQAAGLRTRALAFGKELQANRKEVQSMLRKSLKVYYG